jgi:tRNA dimethylallyltransferase
VAGIAMTSKAAAVAIVGPTASGKSAAALAVAREFDGTVINADSMQVYRELSVLTARPDADALAQAPHRLYGFASGAEPFSAARWRDLASDEIAGARTAGRLPILVGGTGLYIKALMEGLAEVPTVPPEVRAAARARREEIGAARFHAELAAVDGEMAARLAPGDTQRVLRAYEVVQATGRSLAEFQRRSGQQCGPALAIIVLAPEWDALDPAIAARCRRMVETGALDEVRTLTALHLDPALPVMKAVGVRELVRHLSGEIVLESALELFRLATRQYAKRQRTWFRHQIDTEDRNMILNEKYSESMCPIICSFIRKVVDQPHGTV